jgi:hypothetical protein
MGQSIGTVVLGFPKDLFAHESGLRIFNIKIISMKKFFLATSFLLTAFIFNSALAQTPVKGKDKLLGRHSFTIQWLTFDNNKPGIATIKKGTGGWYDIKGEQKNDDGFVSISGKIKMSDPKKLLFEGTITYAIMSINDGKECKKEGPHVFLSTKNRKYWRMQDMDSCEGGTTDYVDIFF